MWLCNFAGGLYAQNKALKETILKKLEERENPKRHNVTSLICTVKCFDTLSHWMNATDWQRKLSSKVLGCHVAAVWMSASVSILVR